MFRRRIKDIDPRSQLGRLREASDMTDQALQNYRNMDKKTYERMKNLSRDEINQFLETIEKSKRAKAEVIIRFIQDSTDYETCRLTLFGSTFF